MEEDDLVRVLDGVAVAGVEGARPVDVPVEVERERRVHAVAGEEEAALDLEEGGAARALRGADAVAVVVGALLRVHDDRESGHDGGGDRHGDDELEEGEAAGAAMLAGHGDHWLAVRPLSIALGLCSSV